MCCEEINTVGLGGIVVAVQRGKKKILIFNKTSHINHELSPDRQVTADNNSREY